MTRGKGERALWAWDTETTDWDKVVCATAVSSAGDVERFTGPDALVEMNALMRKAGGSFGAHAGGIFDTLLLMNAREEPFEKLLVTGSSVLCAQEKSLRVRDTYRWFLSGLAKVGEYLEKCEREDGYKRHAPGTWLKKEVDRNRIGELTMAEQLSYCESDSRILLEGMIRAKDYMRNRGARDAWTSGASALALLQAMEPSSWRALNQLSLDFDDHCALTGSDDKKEGTGIVRGARVERWVHGRVSGVHCYDFKSAYPAAYADQALGLGARPAKPRDRDAVWRCRWKNAKRDILAPVLDSRTLAGSGVCEAWLVREEIEDLEEAGIQVKRIEGWAPEAMFPIGQLFCRDLFDEKERGSFFAKVFLNSFHGKTTEGVIKEAWKSGDKPADFYGPEPTEMIGGYWRYLTLALDKKGRVPCHIQPIAGAQILGRTRSRLYRAAHAVLRANGDLYYSDTDSLHCSLAPSAMPMHLGSGLGQLAWEGGPYDAIYLGPKAYCLIPTSETVLPSGKAPTIKGALKGVPWGEMRRAVVDETAKDGTFYRQARAGDPEARSADRRVEIFERVLEKGFAAVQKEGIRSFRAGVKAEAWERATLVRRIKPTGRGKWVGARGDWYYLSPPEVKASEAWGVDSTVPGDDPFGPDDSDPFGGSE